MDSDRVVRLPCDCVTDVQMYASQETFTCPWCDAEFRCGDLEEWFKSPRVVYAQRAYPLLACGKMLLEFVDVCDSCAVPVVRERGNRASRLHLSQLAGFERLAN
jgi:hypothetical protein